MAYLSLFIGSFLAATILPLSSEGILWYMITQNHSLTLVLLTASAGNFLGGLSCYYLGWYCNWRLLRKYMGIKRESLSKVTPYIKKYGYGLGLLCWLPIIGDPIAVGLGLFRTKPIITFPLMLFGKMGRYIVIIFSLNLWIE